MGCVRLANCCTARVNVHGLTTLRIGQADDARVRQCFIERLADAQRNDVVAAGSGAQLSRIVASKEV